MDCAVTLEQKRARNVSIVARVQMMPRRNVPRVAQEFGVSRPTVERAPRAAGVPSNRRPEAQPHA